MSELHTPPHAESVQLSSGDEEAINRYVAYIAKLVEGRCDAPDCFSGEEQLRVLAPQLDGKGHERALREWGGPSTLNRLARLRLYAALGAVCQYPAGLVVYPLSGDMVQFVQPVTLENGFAIEERTDYLKARDGLNALCSELFLVYQPR